MNSMSKSTSTTASSWNAAVAASLSTCCRIQPRTGGNGRRIFTVNLLKGTGTNDEGKKSASQRYMRSQTGQSGKQLEVPARDEVAVLSKPFHTDRGSDADVT